MPDHPVPWRANDVVDVPATAVTAIDITSCAKQLTPREVRQLLQTYDAGLFEMASVFVWSRTMAGLKKQLALLGTDFIAELLDRPDIRSDSLIHEILTDYDAVRLAEQLGMFGSSHALRLRHALETVTHFADPPADADDSGMMPEEAIGVLRTCVQTVLGHEELSVAVEFVEFRSRLSREVFLSTSPEAVGLISAPYFFRRTVLRVLLAGSKAESGAQLENTLANLNSLLPLLWDSMMAPDRFLVGRAYAEMHADGQTKAASGIRSALLKVSGFDYVPENLRASVFLEAAAAVLEVHFAWENFRNEPAPMRALASLGTSIPLPAFPQCMTAILAVRLGNRYGQSWDAQVTADLMLQNVTADRWQYYLDQCLPADDVILAKLHEPGLAGRWCEIMSSLDELRSVQPRNNRSAALLAASLSQRADLVAQRATSMWSAARG